MFAYGEKKIDFDFWSTKKKGNSVCIVLSKKIILFSSNNITKNVLSTL